MQHENSPPQPHTKSGPTSYYLVSCLLSMVSSTIVYSLYEHKSFFFFFFLQRAGDQFKASSDPWPRPTCVPLHLFKPETTSSAMTTHWLSRHISHHRCVNLSLTAQIVAIRQHKCARNLLTASLSLVELHED